MMFSSTPVTGGSVHLYYRQEDDQRAVFNSNLRWLKHGILGPYRTLMAIGTLANKYFHPDDSITAQTPSIQGYFETAAYYCGLNPTFPYITELHLPRSPIWYGTVQIPCTRIEMQIPLLQFPVNTFHVQSDPVLNKVVLTPHRKVGFSGGSDSYLAALKLLQNIFPETEFTEDDFLLTSGPNLTEKGHTQIIKALNGKKIDQVIKLEGEELINRWKNYAKYDEPFDLPTEMRRFAAAVITQVVFDSREGHEDLEKAVSFMNNYLLKSALGMANEGDKEKFQTSCNTFKTLTNSILEGEKADSLSLFQDDFTLAQKQGLCLLMFFAGLETTAFALSHNFASIALSELQQTILSSAIQQSGNRDDPTTRLNEVDEFVEEQLSKLPPVGGLSRKLTEDAVYTFEASNKKMYKYMRKGEKILTKLSSEFIFGKGANRCIGKMLAMKELKQSIHIILTHFELLTNEKEFHHVDKVTAQAEPFSIKVKERT